MITYSILFILNLKEKYTILPDNLENDYKLYNNQITSSSNYTYIKKSIESMIKIKKPNENVSKLEENKMLITSILNKL